MGFWPTCFFLVLFLPLCLFPENQKNLKKKKKKKSQTLGSSRRVMQKRVHIVIPGSMQDKPYFLALKSSYFYKIIMRAQVSFTDLALSITSKEVLIGNPLLHHFVNIS